MGDLGHWEFGSVAKGGRSILDKSEYHQTLDLPPGTWALVPGQSPVLMPLQITSDSTWKGNNAEIPGWATLTFSDKNWLYAWDMLPPQDWKPPTTDARWIWAAQPTREAGTTPVSPSSKSCSAFWQPSCTCPNCSYGSFPAKGNVFIRKVIDLPGNPAEATATAQADDTCTLYVNGLDKQGDCSSFTTSPLPQDNIKLNSLHDGQNVIAIQANNIDGSAGVLVIIKTDFYETWSIP